MILTLAELAINLVEGFFLTWFITKMLPLKNYEYFSFICCWLFTAASLSFCLFSKISRWNTWIYIFIIMYAVLFFSGPLKLKLFWSLIPVIFSRGITGIAGRLFALMLNIDFEKLLLPGIYRVIYASIACLLNGLFLIFITRIFSRKEKHTPPSCLLIVSSLLYLFLIDFFFVIQGNYGLSLSCLLIGCSIVLILEMLSVVLYLKTMEQTISEQRQYFQEQQLKDSRLQMEALEETYKKLLHIRHDINSFTNTLKELNVTDHTILNPAIINQLEAETTPSYSTGNITLDSVLPIKIQSIHSKGFIFHGTNIHYTGGMNMNDFSLCSLVSNMLDNATEALQERADLPGEKYINLRFIYSPSGLTVLCENPLLGQLPQIKKKSFLSGKSEPFHGLGISIMEKIVNDAGGQFNILIEDDVFRVIALIPPLPAEEKKELYS